MRHRIGWVVALGVGLVPCLATDGRAQAWSSSGSYSSNAAGPRANEVSVRVGLGTAFFIQGAVSEDATNPPDYDEAFGPAFGGTLEVDVRLSREFAAQVGLGYVQHQGDSDQNIDYDAWTLIPFYAGLKVFPRLGTSTDTEVYFRLDIGAVQSQGVDVSISIPPFGTVSGDFYETSTLFLVQGGFGLAYRPRGTRMKIWGEVGYRGMTGPDIKSSSDTGEWSGAITIQFGVAFLV